jgi:hypothetical protein
VTEEISKATASRRDAWWKRDLAASSMLATLSQAAR